MYLSLLSTFLLDHENYERISILYLKLTPLLHLHSLPPSSARKKSWKPCIIPNDGFCKEGY